MASWPRLSPRPGEASLLGHQCPLETVPLGWEPQEVVEGGEPEVWQHQAALGRAALRISKPLFGVAWKAGGLWRGKEPLSLGTGHSHSPESSITRWR